MLTEISDDTLVDCWSCSGTGTQYSFHAYPLQCDRCVGSGKCPAIMLEWQERGEENKEKRIARRITLRQFAEITGISVDSLSRAERGIVDPEPYAHLYDG